MIWDRNRNNQIFYKRSHSKKGLWWYDGKPHTTLGKKMPQTSARMRNEGNPNWHGDKVAYAAVHTWVRARLPMPKLCEICNAKPPHDLANTTGKYTRALLNWKYLCRRCHMLSDGRIDKLKQMGMPFRFVARGVMGNSGT